MLLPADLPMVRFGEIQRHFRWIVMFRFDWQGRDRPLLDHIFDNYPIRQIGYMLQERTEDETLLYYVLERGGAVLIPKDSGR